MIENLSLGLSTTLVGILVVFSGLVILILCISIMGMLTRRSEKKKEGPVKTPLQEAPAALPVTQEAAPQEDVTLIAVITAAIAAVWQGEQSSFVVRRIRRSDSMNARARAAREEQIYTHL